MCRCVGRDEDGRWDIKDNRRTYPVVKLRYSLNTQHPSGAVYQVGDQFTETRYDKKTTIERERPSHSPAKEHTFPGNEGESPAPRRQKPLFSIFKMSGGQAYRDQTKSKPSQNHTLEKATAKEEVPIFEAGQGFTFAPKIVDT